jgi:hypothetical protein
MEPSCLWPYKLLFSHSFFLWCICQGLNSFTALWKIYYHYTWLFQSVNLASISLKVICLPVSLRHQECPFHRLQSVTKVGVTFTAGQDQLNSLLLHFYVSVVIAGPPFYVAGWGEGIRFRLFGRFYNLSVMY